MEQLNLEGIDDEDVVDIEGTTDEGRAVLCSGEVLSWGRNTTTKERVYYITDVLGNNMIIYDPSLANPVLVMAAMAIEHVALIKEDDNVH